MKGLKFLPILFGFFVMGFVDVVGTASAYVKNDFQLSDKVAGFLPSMILPVVLRDFHSDGHADQPHPGRQEYSTAQSGHYTSWPCFYPSQATISMLYSSHSR